MLQYSLYYKGANVLFCRQEDWYMRLQKAAYKAPSQDQGSRLTNCVKINYHILIAVCK
ncbi:hypothetical protein ACJMK2_016207, partial [Sinanodonta woodiana]